MWALRAPKKESIVSLRVETRMPPRSANGSRKLSRDALTKAKNGGEVTMFADQVLGGKDHDVSVATLAGPHPDKFLLTRPLPVEPPVRRNNGRVLRVSSVVLLTLLCLGWTVWLTFLTASPTATVNRLMGTRDLDYGSFWRLSESPKSIAAAGVVGFSCLMLGYVGVLAQIGANTITGFRKRFSVGSKSKDVTWSGTFVATLTRRLRVIPSVASDATLTSINDEDSSRRWSARLQRRASDAAKEMMNNQSQTRRNLNTFIKVADLAIQCVFLVQLMEEGLPVALIGVFAACVTLNALCAAIMFTLAHENVGGVQLLADTTFDFVVAGAFPMLVVIYSLSSFTFDETLIAINTQVFPPGLFEHEASVVADPVQVTVIRRTLDSLRINSVGKLFTRLGTNAALLRRVLGLAELVRAHNAGHLTFPNVYPTRKRSLAALFFVVAIAVVAFTTGSIHTSSSACEMHPECVQIARRWVFNRAPNDPTRCPCLAMIDRRIAIATYDEWATPVDRTQKLAQLAASGRLQTLQLVNRALPSLPEELRLCRQLKHLSLLYTETTTLPDWFAEFTHLEFLHIEGKSLNKVFHELPDHLFDDMHELTFIHLAVQALQRLPSFDGLTNLRTLSLGALFFLTELPSFDRLENLEWLTLAGLLHLEAFPDLTHVRALQSLITVDRGAYCCNGFLGPDKCDLGRSLCQNHFLGLPAITQCLPPDRVASSATRAYFNKFAYSACSGEAMRGGEIKLVLTREDVEQCNGTMFRACEASHAPPGTPAMCYNSRWMAIACEPSPFPMEMRRRQIAMGRGVPCDPQVEAWLGCK